MSRVTFKDRVRHQREQEILTIARQHLREHGYHDLNMDKLADEVGIAKPTLYQHFKSKDDLIAQVIIGAMQTLEAHLHTHQQGSPRERLEQIVRMILYARYLPNGPMASIETELLVSFIRSNAVVRDYKERASMPLRDLIEAGKAAGEIDRNMPTDMIIGWMFCSSNTLRASHTNADDTFWENHVDQEINILTRAFMRGIAPVSYT
jgi:AcrR family transcriptional regulator